MLSFRNPRHDLFFFTLSIANNVFSCLACHLCGFVEIEQVLSTVQYKAKESFITLREGPPDGRFQFPVQVLRMPFPSPAMMHDVHHGPTLCLTERTYHHKTVSICNRRAQHTGCECMIAFIFLAFTMRWRR